MHSEELTALEKDWMPTYDVVEGDTVRWTEPVWPANAWSRKRWGRKPARPIGWRTIVAIVENENYGVRKQQHTFSLRVIHSEGDEAPEPGQLILRKGRTLYRNGVERLLWTDEEARKVVAEEKHERGAEARYFRKMRIEHGL